MRTLLRFFTSWRPTGRTGGIAKAGVAAIAGAFSLIGSHAPAQATPLLDQSNTHLYATTIAANPSRYQQQFTVGLAGQLTEVDLDMGHWGTGSGSVTIRIAKSTGPYSGSSWLFNQVIATPSGATFMPIDLSALNLAVAVGDKFVIDWSGASSNEMFAFSEGNFGPDPFKYAGGDLYQYQGSAWTDCTSQSGYSGCAGEGMLFKTYVNQPTPANVSETGSTALLGSGLLMLGSLARRRRR